MPLDRAHRETKKLLVASGAPPEIIYAFEKTGRIVTEQNKQFLTKAEIREWEGAIRELRRIPSGV